MVILQEDHLEVSERAKPLLNKLEETKTKCRDQIFSIVESRQPFANVEPNDFSALGALNFLTTSPAMVAEAKAGATTIASEYKEKYPQMAAAMGAFIKLLEQPEVLKTHRDNIRNRVFHYDKEEVNNYLLLIAAYIDVHIERYIKFIQAIDASNRLQEKFGLPWGFLDVSLEEVNASIDKVMEFKEVPMSLLMPLTSITTQRHMAVREKKEESTRPEFSEKWLESILQMLIKYSKVEKDLTDEYSHPIK